MISDETLLAAAHAMCALTGVTPVRSCVFDHSRVIVQDKSDNYYELEKHHDEWNFQPRLVILIRDAETLAQLGYFGALPAPPKPAELAAGTPESEVPARKRWWQ